MRNSWGWTAATVFFGALLSFERVAGIATTSLPMGVWWSFLALFSVLFLLSLFIVVFEAIDG